MSLRRLALVGACVAAAWPSHAGSVRAQAQEPQAVVFAASDSVQVSGSLFLPEKTPAPGVVLLPMASRGRHDWETTCEALANAGLAALAIDFRPAFSAAAGDAGNLPDLARDAAAARAYLGARPEIIPDSIGMLGASLGANVAAIAASNDPSLRSLGLLSASLDYRGLRIEPAWKKYGRRPALLVVSSEDAYALRSARALVLAGDGYHELRVLSGAGHGTVMLARQPDLIEALVDWFLRTLL